ncbi:MAG TPA: A/G-specific adenine glycosylase [bacterium]
MDARFKTQFQKRLLAWFDIEKRDLPWRRTNDPYRILVSEVMLQQTQAATAAVYYKRFIRLFPNVRKLARAPLDDVLKSWEGLGYYGRARNLHRTARMVAASHGGKVPDAFETLAALPGIGRSTAGAVLSIAFGKRMPILDGNVIRLLSRVFRITENVDSRETRARLWSLSERLLPETRLRAFNEGLMELGASVCRPRNPACGSCPFSRFCQAKRLSLQGDLPIRTPKKSLPHFDVTAGVVSRNGKFLITKRPPKGLLGGLWEFPGGKLEKGETLKACLRREIREELGITVRVGQFLVSIRHAYSHFKITLHVYRCRYEGGRIRLRGCDDYAWIGASELERYAFPGADRKIIQRLKEDQS